MLVASEVRDDRVDHIVAALVLGRALWKSIEKDFEYYFWLGGYGFYNFQDG